jgi:hypothetical protein
MCFSDPERSTLAEIGKRLGPTALQQVACVAKLDTILAWYRRADRSQIRRLQTPRLTRAAPIAPEMEALIIRIARENSGGDMDGAGAQAEPENHSDGFH